MSIIGILGHAGVGKDTLADYLVHRVAVNDSIARKVSLADPIKRVCKTIFEFTDVQLYGPSAERDKIDPRYGFSPREALQKLGTEYGRALFPNVWVNMLLRDIRDAKGGVGAGVGVEADGVKNFVIPDVRFVNEVEAIQAAGGFVVRLYRDTGTPMSTHTSETEMDTIPDGVFDLVMKLGGGLRADPKVGLKTAYQMYDELFSIENGHIRIMPLRARTNAVGVQ